MDYMDIISIGLAVYVVGLYTSAIVEPIVALISYIKRNT